MPPAPHPGGPVEGITRRAVLGAVPASVIAAPAFAARKSRRSKPNIVFVLADDLGYADLSCYGRRDYETPHIDRLAAGGTRFRQAYANSPVCSATRTALMTGRYQYRLPIGLEEPLTMRDVGLPPSHPTLPGLLRGAGYRTALVGKWHLGALPAFGPLQSGYDSFWGFRGGSVDYFTHRSPAGPDLWDGDHPVAASGYLTDLLGDRAIAVVRDFAAGDRPFFLSLHFSAPHWPWEGPQDEAESRRLAKTPGLMAMIDLHGGSMKAYAAMVTRMDFQVGRLMAELARLGLEDDTIVIMTSDNGGERFSDTWPFSGKKTQLLEGGVRVPAIMKWPGRVRKGAESDQVMITMDWLPTLLAAAGVPLDSRFPSDGIDIVPTMGATSPPSRTLFWRYMNLNQRSCRSGKWKYLKILDNEFLFDLDADPLERANLRDREPAVFSDLKERYAGWDKTMLPMDRRAFTHVLTARDQADQIGIERSVMGDP